MEASAVRFAWRDVTPKVMPSTATTSTAAARKTFAKSPNVGLVALVPGIGLILFPVLVFMGPPLVAACIECDLHVSRAGRPDRYVLDDLGGDPLVPHVQAVLAGRDILDRERPIHPR